MEKQTKGVKPQEIIDDVKSLWPISLRRYKKEGKYKYQTIQSKFGSWQALMSVMGLKVTKEVNKLYNNIAKHATNDLYKQFYKEEITPWLGKYQKSKKSGIATLMIINDLHDIDVDDFTLSVFIDSVKRIKPDHVVINGDCFDCPEFGRYTKDPRAMDAVKRFKFVHERILAPIRKAAGDKCEITFIIGNHEYRLLKYMAEKCPELMVLMSDFMGLRLKDFFGLDKYKINLICKSDLTAWSKNDIKKEMKKNYKIFYDCFAVAHEKNLGFKMDGCSGHTHRCSITDHKAASGGYLWYVYPAATIPDANYMEGLSSADCGFGIVHIDIERKQVQQQMIVTTNGFCEVGGKFYKRK